MSCRGAVSDGLFQSTPAACGDGLEEGVDVLRPIQKVPSCCSVQTKVEFIVLVTGIPKLYWVSFTLSSPQFSSGGSLSHLCSSSFVSVNLGVWPTPPPPDTQ